ncbi:MAG: response regulator [Chloroflexi bacterium]|nr:response regulator [Chloroflexota bacterium]
MTRILIIEDQPNFRDGLAEILRLNRYEVVTAADGLEGFQAAREHLPDIIICDIMMPEMDGYEVLRELRSASSTAVIPFIFLTAKADTPDLRLGMELGADDYLTKPFREAELLAVIKTRLQKRASVEAEQLRTLSRRFVRLEESERRALAQRVHDEITQPLAGLNLTLQGIRQLPFQQLDEELEKLQSMAENLLTRVTVTTEDLWPVILDELGLLPAMLYQFEQFSAHAAVRVNFIHRGLDRTFSPEVKITVYRLIEEILSNAAQYAHVDELMLRAWMDDSTLQIEFQDQGIGFEVEKLFDPSSASGLVAIRERVYALGGDMVIMSSPGAGVRVSAKIPCRDAHGNVIVRSPRLDAAAAPYARIVANPPVVPNVPELGILIAEENEIIRQGLIRLLETEFSILGEVNDSEQVVNRVQELQPSVLILGITMGGASSLDLIQPALEVCAGLRVLVLSGSINEIYAYEALRHGASGFMLNSAGVSDLIDAVHVVARGDEYWSAALHTDSIKQRLDQYQDGDPETDSYNALTSREREILKLVAQGLTSKQIAGTLSISPRTAETHRSNIAHKLGLHTQSELIRYAIKRGIVPSEE